MSEGRRRTNRATICVAGGAGHVGAPLSVALADTGFDVVVYDWDERALAALAEGRMPFAEARAQRSLTSVLRTGRLTFSADPATADGVPNVILAIDASSSDALMPCIESLLPFVDDGACLIVRSTVAPGTTDALDRALRDRGRSLLLAVCPERSVQGAAIEEMHAFPQIVGGVTVEASQRAAEIFRALAPQIVEMLPIEAEYAKLLCNAYRYLEFAVANQLYMALDSAGLDYHRVLDMTRLGYPRMAHLPRAGFTAGPCLPKDTELLAAADGGGFALGRAAAAINQGMPAYVVERLAREHTLHGARVGILGVAFKAESDDVRSSQSYALGELLRGHGAEVGYSDEYVTGPSILEKQRLIDSADIIIIAVPHRAYATTFIPDTKIVIDICNCR